MARSPSAETEMVYDSALLFSLESANACEGVPDKRKNAIRDAKTTRQNNPPAFFIGYVSVRNSFIVLP